MLKKYQYLTGLAKRRKSDGKKRDRQALEPPTEVPMLLALLVISIGVAILILAGMAFVFFRT